MATELGDNEGENLRLSIRALSWVLMVSREMKDYILLIRSIEETHKIISRET